MIELTIFFPRKLLFKNTASRSPRTVLITVTTMVNRKVIRTDL